MNRLLPPDSYGCLHKGQPVQLFTLTNSQGLAAAVTNYGGRLVQLLAPDKKGNFHDIVLSHPSFPDLQKAHTLFGATVGRFDGLIDRGKFSLSEKSYQLSQNAAPHHSQGGQTGSPFQVFQASQPDLSQLILTYTFRDGEEGYPGNCHLTTTFTLTEANELVIEHLAKTDQPTIINLTNHIFWNLSGPSLYPITEEELMVSADFYTPVTAAGIPTGEIHSVMGTPFDFRKSHPIGSRISDDHEQLRYDKGYNVNFVLRTHRSSAPELAASLYDPFSGRTIDVLTTEPGLQFDSGNHFAGHSCRDKGKNNVLYDCRQGLSLKTQHFPDSPNHSHFPPTTLLPDQPFSTKTIYRFGVKK